MASRRRLSCALAVAVALAAVPAASAAEPRALVASVPLSAGLLDQFAAAGMSVGLMSPVTGGYEPGQLPLDVSQGARIPTRLYDDDLPALRLSGGRLGGWAAVLERAADAPGDLEPGLMAATLERAGRRVAYAGGGFLAPAAADRAGRVDGARGAMPAPGTVLVADLPGLAAVRAAARLPDTLVIVFARPPAERLRLLPAGMAGPGEEGMLRSATTRRDGLIAATDIAPTVLRHMGVAVPGDIQGQEIERTGDPALDELRTLAARLDVVTSRRGPALLAFAALLLAAALVAGRRIPLLAVLWLPSIALLAAALRPSEAVEVALLAAGPVVLAFATDRLVPWPRGPWVPAAAALGLHALDLIRGSDLIGQAVTGPNPAGGARFYGVGNELETLLSLTLLLGVGAWLSPDPGKRAPVVFGVAGALGALVLGAGRLGADVGAVITLGAGTAAAVVASLPGGPTRRAVAIAVATPLAAVALLGLVDLATGGDSHFARSVLGADEGGDLGEVARRRIEGSLSGLGKPGAIVATLAAVAALAALAARRGRFDVPRPLGAALVGCWFAVVAGALGNDSGPLILWVGAAMLGLAVLYAKRPDRLRES